MNYHYMLMHLSKFTSKDSISVSNSELGEVVDAERELDLRFFLRLTRPGVAEI